MIKHLFSKPVLLAFVLTIILWFVFSNFILALVSAILISFFIGMLRALYTLSKKSKDQS